MGVWGPETHFTGPPFFPPAAATGAAADEKEEKEGADETFTFAVFGDMGTAEEDGSLDFGGEEVRRGFCLWWVAFCGYHI